MKRFLGRYIKIFLSSGVTAEGFLCGSEDDKLFLRCTDSNDVLVVFTSVDKIDFIRVFTNEPIGQPPHHGVSPSNFPHLYKGVREPEPPKLNYVETNPTQRAKKLATSRMDQIGALRKNVARHLNRQIEAGPQQYYGISNYELPNFTK
jgi:hypothetical protein